MADQKERPDTGNFGRWKGLLTVGIYAMLFLCGASSRYWMTAYREADVTTKQAVGQMQQEEEQEGTDMGKKVAYLTFDDGPGIWTEEYLDILKKHEVKATFFLIGSQVTEETEDIVKREIREGHEIGIHTYLHQAEEIYQSQESYYQDVLKMKRMLKKKFDYDAKLWRFPWGSANYYINSFRDPLIEELQKEGLDYADWNVSAEDSVGTPTCQTILQNVTKNCFSVEEPVILMHDSNTNQATKDSLEQIIISLEQRGYTFATLSERSSPCHFGEYN